MHHVLINPTAGNGRAVPIGEMVSLRLTELSIPHKTILTERVGHATELARAAASDGVGTVISVGGDGTVSEIVQGLAHTGTALAIIPAGTGNDMSKTLGIPKQPLEALEFALSHPPRKTDAGRLNDFIFINVCGTGFDVQVLEYAEIAKKYVRGMLPYLWGVIRTIFTFHPVMATFSADGEAPVTGPLLILAVANGRCFGGGIEIAPDAVPDDGLFDLVTVDEMPRRIMPFQLPKLVGGRVMQIPGVSYRRCKTVTVTAPNMRVNIDGGIHPVERAEFSMLPGAMLVHW